RAHIAFASAPAGAALVTVLTTIGRGPRRPLGIDPFEATGRDGSNTCSWMVRAMMTLRAALGLAHSACFAGTLCAPPEPDPAAGAATGPQPAMATAAAAMAPANSPVRCPASCRGPAGRGVLAMGASLSGRRLARSGRFGYRAASVLLIV